MALIGSVWIYLCLSSFAAGAVSLLKPLRFLGIRTRKRGLPIAVLAVCGLGASVFLPVAETRVAVPRTRLDEFVPTYQFNEFHSIVIDASKERVYAAIGAVTPEEIRLYRTLTWIRRFGKSSPGGVLNPPGRQPIMKTFLSSFAPLADEPGREIVFGFGAGERRGVWLTTAEMKTCDRPKFTKVAMNFEVREVDATHSLLTTETRIYAKTPDYVRAFGVYWRLIYPGSALIRRGWLRAIKQRAEGGESGISTRSVSRAPPARAPSRRSETWS